MPFNCERRDTSMRKNSHFETTLSHDANDMFDAFAFTHASSARYKNTLLSNKNRRQRSTLRSRKRAISEYILLI